MAAKLLAMFPGQGSQYVGMGRELLAQFPAANALFEEAEDACHVNLRQLCLEGPESELTLTANTQPCILTVSAAIWRVMRDEAGLTPAFYAGHSLGEYTALVACNKLSLYRAAFLVRKRGEAMQQAVPAGVGAMAAVLNVAVEDLKARCQAISKPGHCVEIANDNSPQQQVVAGNKGAVDELVRQLEAAKIRAVPLAVSAPFHSSLMGPAREAMTPLLEETSLAANQAKVIANLTGKVESPYAVSLLIKQIDSPVLWTQSINTAAQEGCDAFVEFGPGKVLAGLARRILPKGTPAKIFATEDLAAALKDLQALQ